MYSLPPTAVQPSALSAKNDNLYMFNGKTPEWIGIDKLRPQSRRMVVQKLPAGGVFVAKYDINLLGTV
jgi:hypothetical protein